jgi:hypothetical protein
MTSERKSRGVLRYVEDYLEESLYMISVLEKPRVELEVEEQRDKLRVRVTLKEPDGRETKHEGEAPRLALKELPSLSSITVAYPPKLPRQVLALTNEIFTETRLQPTYKIQYVLQAPLRAFSEIKETTSLHLPVLPTFYSWFGDDIKPIALPSHLETRAFTTRPLIRLSEILLKLPKIAEDIRSDIKIPALAFNALPRQGEIKTTLKEVAETLRAKVQAQQLRNKGLLELLFFEEEEKLRRLRKASEVHAGEPVLIILPESKGCLWYLFWVVCRELYREAKGVYPEPVVLLDKGHDVWLRLFGGLSGRVVVLRKEQVEKAEAKEWFKRRLQEAFSQGLGYLIIMAGAESVSEAVEFVRELSKPYTPMIVDIRTTSDSGQILETLARALSTGFGIPYDELCRVDNLKNEEKVSVSVGERSREFPRVDVMVSRADRAYRDFVNELLSSEYIACVERDVSEKESEDHIAMKALTVKYLSEKCGVKPEEIKCTCEVKEDVIADLYVKVREKGLAIECETMFGTAPTPLLKVFESVRKYMGANGVSEVWVVVRNWSAILHLGDLLWAESLLKDELKEEGKDVKFFVPEIYEKSLKPLSEAARAILLRRESP